MRFIERIILGLFPKLIIKNTPWELMWEAQEKDEFVNITRIVFPIISIVFILHYFTVDRAEGLAPSTLWFNYRFGMASIALLCLIFYSIPSIYRNVKFYRLPTIIAFSIFCYFQTKTIIWYPKVPYLYTFAFIILGSIILRTHILKSLLFVVINIVICWPLLIKSGQSRAMMLSASIVTFIFTIFSRAKYLADLKYYAATQANIDQQKKFIELNMEFTNQVKAFLPLKISKKLTFFIQQNRMSVLQAIDQVLRPRKSDIACLFTDIRGYTKKSSSTDFILNAMLPNVKESTQIIESYSGIPRKIGDLIFSYFDEDEIILNILNSIASAVGLNELNEKQNAALSENLQIQRFILISSGEAIVGNLSGYNSSIEITALGEPVNLLSRIDEMTKNAIFKNLIKGDKIILDKLTVNLLLENSIDIDFRKISLKDSFLKIRDFDSIEEVYVMPINTVNINKIKVAFQTKKMGFAA